MYYTAINLHSKYLDATVFWGLVSDTMHTNQTLFLFLFCFLLLKCVTVSKSVWMVPIIANLSLKHLVLSIPII